MPLTIDDSVLALRKSGGYCCLTDYRILEVFGPDAATFLQSRLSNDVKALAVGQGQLTSLLDRKAHVLALMSLHRISEQAFLILVHNEAQRTAVLHQLDTFHFNEKVDFRKLDYLTICTMQGPKAELLLSLALNGRPRPGAEEYAASEAMFWDNIPTTVIRLSLTGESGFILGFNSDSGGAKLFEDAARKLEMIELTPEVLNVARIEAGILEYGKDVSIENLLPESGLENTAASYSKGCFQGQEVLARIRTYGTPRRGLVGIQFKNGGRDVIPSGSSVQLNSQEIGSVTSSSYSPTLDCMLALAYVNKEHRIPNQPLTLEIAGKSYDATVVILPFYDSSNKKERASKTYNQGLSEFATGSEAKAIELLRETIELDPVFANAYEALGVILSRQEQLDEAIDLMKRLTQLDPDSIMAHSNLSVFYMQKGDKEAAEDEKAKAMSIRMSQMAKQVVSEQKDREDAAKRKKDAEQRIDLFRQVLTIDPEDFLANSGMGSALVDMEKFEEALAYLEKALLVKSNHTLTYAALAQAYEKLQRTSEAVDTYKRGIAVAAQRGELTPLKDMQSRMESLLQSQSTSGAGSQPAS